MAYNIEDRILIEELLNGNLKAFDLLFNKYAKRLYGFSIRYLKSASEAEELVQNVFFKVWENRNMLKKELSFKSYLFTIAYNDILKFFRSTSYHQAYLNEVVGLSELSNNTVESVEYASVLEEVDKLIEQLPDKRKSIFIKSRKEGKSSKEIAEELNMSAGSVDNNISEALKFLRDNLKYESLSGLLFFTLFIQ